MTKKGEQCCNADIIVFWSLEVMINMSNLIQNLDALEQLWCI